jgi:hypothetical protein
MRTRNVRNRGCRARVSGNAAVLTWARQSGPRRRRRAERAVPVAAGRAEGAGTAGTTWRAPNRSARCCPPDPAAWRWSPAVRCPLTPHHPPRPPRRRARGRGGPRDLQPRDRGRSHRAERQPRTPRRQTSPTTQHPSGAHRMELEQINTTARVSGNDAVLLRLHTETACRRGVSWVFTLRTSTPTAAWSSSAKGQHRPLATHHPRTRQLPGRPHRSPRRRPLHRSLAALSRRTPSHQPTL